MAALPDKTDLKALLKRTVFEGDEHIDADLLCAYAADAYKALQGQETAALLAGEARWPAL